MKGAQRHTQLALFPADRAVPEHALAYGVQVRLDAMELHRPRQWGACWLACQLYEQLELDRFWAEPLAGFARRDTCWQHILQTLVCYRLIDPGSEWRLHRQWFEQSAMADLLGADYALAEKNALYRCLDKLLAHKEALFTHLRAALAGSVRGAVRSAAVRPDEHLFRVCAAGRRSRQAPLRLQPRQAQRLRAGGDRADRHARWLSAGLRGAAGQHRRQARRCADFLRKIEAQYGKANRIWVMDRGIPTEEVLAEMRRADPPVYYLVGTPKGRLSKLEKALLGRPWQAVREGVDVKLLPQEQELYVLAQSRARIHKERAMRRRKLKWLWARLKQISAMNLEREELLMKLGAARAKARGGVASCSISRWPPTAATLQLSRSIARSCAKCAGAKAATSCAPICADGTRPSCGSSTSSSSRSRPPSRT